MVEIGPKFYDPPLTDRGTTQRAISLTAFWNAPLTAPDLCRHRSFHPHHFHRLGTADGRPAAIDVGGQFLKDKAQFTQNTTGGEMSSTASVTYLSALTGIRTLLGGTPLGLGVNGGYSVAITRRSIDNCVDCQVDKLDIPGGAFVEPLLLITQVGARRRYARAEGQVRWSHRTWPSIILSSRAVRSQARCATHGSPESSTRRRRPRP